LREIAGPPSPTIENMPFSPQPDWFEVTEIRGHIVDGGVGHFQVMMKIGLKMEG
jgi:hypothetical protein